jgi:hypothetical protein
MTPITDTCEACGYGRPDPLARAAVLPSPSDHAEMPKRMVGRKVVRTCSCGKPWPCDEARWNRLRDQITRDAETEQELGDGYSEMGTDESETRAVKHWGRAGALREVLAAMDRMEAE